jgi:hypothetical protein
MEKTGKERLAMTNDIMAAVEAIGRLQEELGRWVQGHASHGKPERLLAITEMMVMTCDHILSYVHDGKPPKRQWSTIDE